MTFFFQYRSDNAFTCSTPLLCNNSALALVFFQSDEFEDEAALLLLQELKLLPCCLALRFLHCNALSAFSPPSCGQIPAVICCKPSFLV